MLKKIVCYVLVTTLVLLVGNTQFVLPVDANHVEKVESKVYDTATMDSDFLDDRVLVVLNNAVSLEARSYTTSDFPEISCKSVQDFSSAKGAKVQAKLRGERVTVAEADVPLMAKNTNVSTFRKILYLKLENPGKENVLSAIKALEKRSDVYYVGPDYILSRGPVMPDYPSNIDWAHGAIQLSYAHQIETGSSAVRVGVVDSGIDVTHPDLQGRVNISLSRNFAEDSHSATTDPLGHGTHVAGIIAGAGNNSYGIDGICQNVTLVSLRVVEVINYTTAGTLANAMDYAEANDIPILNMSLCADSPEVMSLHQAFENYSGVVVVAAGNDNNDIDNGFEIPTAFDYDNIICVGSSTQANAKASTSNYGQQAVDLFAPGDAISSCYPRALCSATNCTRSGHIGYGYHYLSGTSMAAPMVASVAALLLSADSNLTCSEIKTMILAGVKEYAAFTNLCVSGGVLNAKNIFSEHTLHDGHTYYIAVSSNRHKYCCYLCDYEVTEPHAWDGMGGCMLCSYSN